jgi:hypothetical protein
VEDAGELFGGAGDDGGIKAEEQAAERTNASGLQEVFVQGILLLQSRED